MNIAYNSKTLPQGADQDLMLKQVVDQFNDKGFVVANVDKVVNWAEAMEDLQKRPQ